MNTHFLLSPRVFVSRTGRAGLVRQNPALAASAASSYLFVAMIDTIKKTLLAGVGAAVITKEKVQDALDDYVRQGKIKADDARIIADKIAERGRREFEEMSAQASVKVQEILHRQDAAVASRLTALEARVAVLEAAANPPPAPTRNGEP
jgi:polyhydroxyalkanoate synthesis regulator phasin